MSKALQKYVAGQFSTMLLIEPTGCSSIEPELFRQLVAARAFYKAEQRGFEPGHELEDWLESEQELLNDPSLLERA